MLLIGHTPSHNFDIPSGGLALDAHGSTTTMFIPPYGTVVDALLVSRRVVPITPKRFLHPGREC